MATWPPSSLRGQGRGGALPLRHTLVGNLEGLLGTGQYQVLPGESAHQLLTRMVDRFDSEAAAAGLTPQSAAALGLSPYQVVTVASIAQKEGYYDRYFGRCHGSSTTGWPPG